MMAYPGLRSTAILLALCATAPAQSLIEPEHLAAAKSAFDSASHASHLRCGAHPIQPALTYGLQLQTGYQIGVPMDQFARPGHSLNLFLRVTPENREPVYLGMSGLVPEVSPAGSEADLHGRFVVGEGPYSVEALVQDDDGRSCYNQWRIQAKRTGSERDLRTAAPTGAVRELKTSGQDTRGGPEIERLTVLVHATAMKPGASKMEPETIQALTDSLSSLLTQLPAKSVRLAVFSLEKQVVLFSTDSFRAADLEDVTRSCDQLELAVVDFKTLQNRNKVDVLSDLIVKELHNSQPSNAILLLGPRTTSQTDSSLQIDGAATPWFYLQYQIVPQVRPAGGGRQRGGFFPPDVDDLDRAGGIRAPDPSPDARPDGIERLVRRINGTMLPVASPHDLADAIHRMAVAIPTVSGPGVTTPSPLPAPPESRPGITAPPPATAPRVRPAAGDETPEPVEPTGEEDPVEVLAHLRDRVVEHSGAVPNHTCVETVQRDRYQPVAGRNIKSCDSLLASRRPSNRGLRMDLTDWLRLDVGLADGHEIFSWAGAAKFEEGEIDQLIPEGAFGTGAFASLLLSIFEDRGPRFTFDGETSLAGRRLLQYSFRVSRDDSGYRVKALREWLVTGYTGTLLVDPRTSDLVRFVVRTEELPAATQMCEVDSTLDYNMVPIGSFEYLLPTATRQRFIGMDGEEGENSLSFASCREFLGESTLSFGRSSPRADSAGEPLATLPLGLPMTIELITPITLGKAAAGDRIEGRLSEPLRDARSQKVLAPLGAKVAGRLTRVELRHSGSGEYTMAVRWERLEIDGEKVPLTLKPNRQFAGLKAVARGVLQQRGMEIELPRPGEERDAVYHFPGQSTRVEGGLRTEWVTTTDH